MAEREEVIITDAQPCYTEKPISWLSTEEPPGATAQSSAKTTALPEPSNEELFSGEFSLLPVSKDDLEEKHVVGIADTVLRAAATWLLGEGDVRKTLASCRYMHLTEEFLGQENTLGKRLLLFVEGVRGMCSKLCELMDKHAVVYPEGFALNNPFPHPEWGSYDDQLKENIDCMSKENFTPLEDAILTRLEVVQTFKTAYLALAKPSTANIKPQKKDNYQCIKDLAIHTALGEEPLGSYASAPGSTQKLVSLEIAMETFTDLLKELLGMLELVQNNRIRSPLAVLEYFSSETKFAFMKSYVAEVVANMATITTGEVLSTSLTTAVLGPNEHIKIHITSTKKDFTGILKKTRRAWENMLYTFCMNSTKMHKNLPEVISELAGLRSEAKGNGLKPIALYLDHIKSFATVVYITLEFRFGCVKPEEYRIMLWILFALYKRMVPKELQAKDPESTISAKFSKDPDSAYKPPLPKKLTKKESGATFESGNVIYSNAYLNYIMAQQLSIMGEVALLRALLNNMLVWEGVAEDKLKGMFSSRVGGIKEKELAFDKFLEDTNFFTVNFDVLYKMSIGYFEASKSMFDELKGCEFTDVLGFTQVMKLNKEGTETILKEPTRGLPSFKKENIITFSPQDTTLPILTVNPKKEENEVTEETLIST